MTLDQLGRWFLPRLAAVVEDAVDYLLAFQLYVERWQEVLEL